MMDIVTVSPKFQVVIPRKLRERFKLKAGQTMVAMEYNGVIQLVPVVPMAEAYGMLGPMDSTIEREPDREF